MKDDGFGDWRIKAVTTLAKDLPAAYPGGPSHKAGTPVYLVTSTKDPDGQEISFTTPCPAALSLNIAANAAKQAMSLRQTIIYGEVVAPGGPARSVTKENTSHLYDFFEHCMVAISFSFQALETFCNDTIVYNIQDTYTITKRGTTRQVSALELQLETSTEDKLGIVLPKILKLKSPKTEAIWQEFKGLKDVRDSVIRLKPNYQANVDIKQEIVFCQFLRDRIDRFPKCAYKLIEHFIEPGRPPRWFELAREHYFKA